VTANYINITIQKVNLKLCRPATRGWGKYVLSIYRDQIVTTILSRKKPCMNNHFH